MARIILKSPYLKPTDSKHIKKYVNYIATREGVVFAESTDKYLPATVKQQELVNSLLNDYPDVKDSFEYEDYLKNPNRENASELISYAVESNLVNRKRYVKYISERPGVEKISSHGLFTDMNVPINISELGDEIANSQSNVWTHIISLRREDAERLGYNTVDAWRTLLRCHAQEIAHEMNIDPDNFKWYAAFHNEGHHPHVHMIAYSTHPKEAYLSREGIMNIKASLANDIFRDDMYSKYIEKDIHRNDIKSLSSEIIDALVKSINQEVFDNPVIENKLIELAKRLANTSGKKVYGYLKADVKSIIDSIVDELEKDERIDGLYNLWYEKKNETIRIYTDEVPERIPLSMNKEFKSIKNMIIQEALNINLDVIITNEGEIFSEIDSEPKDSDAEEEEKPNFSFEYLDLLTKARKGNKWSQYGLAKYLLNKENPEYNPDEAIKWLEKSASKGYTVAEYMLGKLYLKGEAIPKDVDMALKWLVPCAEKGNSYAQYILGKAYMKGEDVPRDMPKAVDYLLSSADQGNKFAMYAVGKLFCDGELVKKDVYNGEMFLKESSRKGFAPADYYLGKMYYLGNDVHKDVDTAEFYLRKAASNDNPYAAYLLGRIYSNEKEYLDLHEAVKYFLQSAQSGNSYGYYQVGKIFYYGGNDFQSNISLAMDYLKTAADMGNEYAEQMLYSIQRHKNTIAANCSLRLLQSLARMMQRRIQDDSAKKQQQGVDRKEQQKINEKKQAHGLRISM